jgi:hypothetical protein
MVSSICPYLCLLFRMCWAYADWGSLGFTYLIAPGIVVSIPCLFDRCKTCDRCCRCSGVLLSEMDFISCCNMLMFSKAIFTCFLEYVCDFAYLGAEICEGCLCFARLVVFGLSVVIIVFSF